MQKIINGADAFVDEMLEGIVLAHPGQLRAAGDPRAIVRGDAPVPGKVGIATGGGSGHLPVFMGYVGEGLADGAAVGNVFASPSADQMLAVTRAIDGGAGVLYIYGNYGGDVMNFDLAVELADAEGIRVETVLGADDVASAPRGEEARRRGIAGIFFLYKVAGARAAEGATLDEVKAVAERAASRNAVHGRRPLSLHRPLSRAPHLRASGRRDGDRDGHPRRAGHPRGPLEPADAIADQLVAAILQDLPHERGDRVAVLVNGLGATPKEELYILYRRAHRLLDDAGLRVHRVWCGEYATSLEMAGASISLLKLDDELARLVDAPASLALLRPALSRGDPVTGRGRP